MKIKITEWKIYQPRNDVKHCSWFRLEHKIFLSPVWRSKYTTKEVYAWVWILANASAENTDILEFSGSILKEQIFLNEKEIKIFFSKLKKDKHIEVLQNERDTSVTDTVQTSSANVVLHNITLHNNTLHNKEEELNLVEDLQKRNPEIERLTKLLYQNLLSIGDTYTKNNPPNFDNWYEDMNLLHTKDQMPIKLIEKIINWVKDDKFWRINIRSASKLRKQFAQLEAKMLNENPEETKKSIRELVAEQQGGNL